MRERRIEAGEHPFTHPYLQTLDQVRRAGRKAPLLKRVSELVSLLDITTTLGSGRASEEALDEALLVVTRELQAAGGAFFVRNEDGALALRSSRGLPPGAPSSVPFILRRSSDRSARFRRSWRSG